MASYADLHAAVQADPRSLPKIAALLKLIRTQKLRQSQVVATHGKTALQDPRRAARVLGDDVWAVYEQTLVAALDVDDAPLRDACQSALLKRFGGANPPSQRLERLEGLVAEAAGDWEAALQRYKGVLAQNPANSTALKREVCVVEAKGAGREAVIAALTKLTATCQSDRGAWQALAEAHAAAYRFSDAIFCYEELTLFDPTAQHYMRRLGELYYSWAASTTAKREPLYRKARVYFAKSLELLGPKHNPRAATGLLLTCSAIKLDVRGRKSDPDDELNAALGSLAASKLKAAYANVDPFLRECNEKLLAAHAPPYARLLPKKNEETVSANRRRSGSGQIGPLQLESPAPRYAQVSAGSLSPAFNPLKSKQKKRVALVFEGLGADPVKARAQVLATSSPLALKLKEAYDGDLEEADAGLPETQLPVCVMLGLLRLESALLSPDVPLGFGDAPLLVCGHSAGFLAAACVALDAEDPFAHAGDAIRCAQRIGKAIKASDTSCALLLPKTPPAVAAMKVRSQTKIQLGLVNAPSSCVLTGSIQDFVDVAPKTVKLPIRWPVHSSLLDEARVAVQDASELDFLDKHPHCVVLSPEDGEECSTLRTDVLGTLTSQPVVWPSVLDAVQARLPDEVIFLGDSYGLLAWHPVIGSKRTYQMKSSDGSFAVKIRAARDEEEEPVVEEEDQEDDSMALFAKKKGKRKDVDAAENMQGHAYFAAMLGILFTHGNIHTLPGKGDPSAAEPWTGLQQLHANLGAGFGLLLFFAVAGVGDERSFWKRGGVEKQTTWEMLKPLVTVYVTMVVLSALTHVTYEGLYRNMGWRWAPKQKKPWPLRPNLTRTKWFVVILALARLVGRLHRRACKKYPKLYPVNVIVSLILMFVIQVEVHQELEWKGSGLGSMAYGRLCGVFMYIVAPSVLPIGLLTPKSYAFASDDNNACIEYAVPHVVLSRWRRLMTCSRRGLSRVAPFFAEEDIPRKDGVVRIPAHVARPLCFLIIYLRLLASASSMGYRAATYDINNDDAWAGTDISKGERWTYAWVCILRSDCKAGGPSMHFSSKGAIYLISILDYGFAMLYSTAACYVAPARRSIFSEAGGLCLFAYMWHRCLLPVLDALVLRVHKETRADALLVLPLYILFQILISAPFPQFREAWERLRKGRPQFRDVANPLWIFAILFLLSLVSYSWG